MYSLSASATPKSLPWLAYGEQREYFEPCGCDPTADLGGVLRLYAMTERERALAPELVLFSLGNILPVTEDQNQKIDIFMDSQAELKPTAYLPGYSEVLHWDAIKSKQRFNFVLSNSDLAPNVLRGERYQIFGYFYSEKFSKGLRKVDKTLLGDLKKLLVEDKQAFLLFSGSDGELEMFTKSKLFNVIVSGNTNRFDFVMGPEERQHPGQLVRMPGVRMVPVGGQGVLRGGPLRERVAPTLQQILKPTECRDEGFFQSSSCRKSGEVVISEVNTAVTWLDKTYEIERPVSTKLVARYNAMAAGQFAERSVERAKNLASSPYIGAQACKGCHAEEYRIWEKSGHAHALATLKAQNKDKDPECVSCHVVGYDKKGGYVSEKLSPQFANVQCETCHGPRKDHVKNPSIRPKLAVAAEKVCTSCHHGTHTVDFNYEIYWSRILHGNQR